MNRKQILSLLLSVLLCVGSIPLNASASAAEETESAYAAASADVYDGEKSIALMAENGVSEIRLAALDESYLTWENTSGGHGVGTYDVLYGYADGSGTVESFDDSIYLHATDKWDETEHAKVTFDIEEFTARPTTFTTKVGIRNTNGSQTNTSGAGSVRFYIRVDGTTQTITATVTPKNGLQTVSCTIPAGAKKLTLEVDCFTFDPSTGTISDYSASNDWSCFYTPTLTTDVYLARLKGTEENGKGSGFGYGTFDAIYNGGSTATFPDSISFGIDASAWDTAGPSVTYDVSDYTGDGDLTFTAGAGMRYQWGKNTASSDNGAAFIKIYKIDADDNQSELTAAWNLSPTGGISNLSATVPQGTKKIKIQASHYLNYTNIHLQWPSLFTPKLAGITFDSVSLDAEKTTFSGTSQLVPSVNGSTEGFTVSYTTDADYAAVDENGLVTATAEGTFTVTATIIYNGITFIRTIRLTSVEPEFSRYLSDMQYSSAVIGYDKLRLDTDMKGEKIHFSGGKVCEKGLFTHADSTVEYDISSIPVKAFRAVVGINATAGETGEGSVIFRVYADGTELYTSPALSRSSEPVEVNVTIPEGTKILQLFADKNGSADSDHSAWGDARITIAEKNGEYIESMNLSSSQVLNVGDKTKITVSGSTLKGDALSDKASFALTSSDGNVVSVSDDLTVTANGNGTAVVTVTASTACDTKTETILFAVGTDEEKGLFRLSSPDEKQEALLCLDENGKAYFAALYDGKVQVNLSAIGPDTSLADFGTGLTLKAANAQTTIDETYTLSAHIKESYRNYANERRFDFKKDGATLSVILRAYNDGVALRYIVDSNAGGTFAVNKENTEIKLPADRTVYAMPYISTHEGLFEKFDGKMTGNYNMPLIVKNNETGVYTTITEAVFNPEYPAAKMVSSTDGFTAELCGNGTTATVSSPFESPYRLFITGDLASIAESSMVTDVAPEPSDGIDYSFVEPGISAWSWLTSDAEGQQNGEVHKKYIDFAAEMGFTYYTLDGDWQKQNGPGSEAEWKEIIPDGTEYYDWTDEVLQYAAGKGVKVLAWVHKKNLEDPDRMNKILESYKAKGIAGIKVDFFNSESADTMALYTRIYKKCAELGLVVNCHGANKPTGEVRTYPNVLAREAIRGDEYWFFGSNNGMKAEQFTIIPFTRGVTGPADVTESLYPRFNNVTTAGSQMALSVVVASGIHYLACAPEQMRATTAYDFYRNFPAVWDETKLLSAEIGEYVSMARRSGSIWYVGGITTNARKNEISLSFLESGTKYYAQLYLDGENDNTRVTETKIVTSADTLSMPTLANGGYAVKLTPLAEVTLPEGYTLNHTALTLIPGDRVRNTALPTSISGNVLRALYTVEDDTVATVSDDGVITAVGVGETTVSLTDPKTGKVLASCTVTVVDTVSYEETAEGTVLYLSGNGDDTNDGSSADKAVSTLAHAFELAANNEGATVIRVSGSIGSDENRANVKNTSEVTIEGVDSNAAIYLNSATLGAPLTLRNILFDVKDFLNTEAKGFTVGENVRTPNRVKVHGGTINKDSAKRDVITVESGSFRIYSGTHYNEDAAHDLAGVLYTFGGTAEIILTFKADVYKPGVHKGTTFSKEIVIVNNGAKVDCNLESWNLYPVTVSGGVSVINNNGAATSLREVSNYTKTSGYRILYAGLGGRIEPTDETGVYAVIPDDGKMAVTNSDGKIENGKITVKNGYSADILFVGSGEAMIGSKVYETLPEALGAAVKGDTVNLISDVTLPENTVVPEGVTVDCKNFKVDGTFLLSEGSFVVSDGKQTVAFPNGAVAEGESLGRVWYTAGALLNEDTLTLYAKNYTVSESDEKLLFTFGERGVSFSFLAEKNVLVTGKDGFAITVRSGKIEKVTAANGTTVTLDGGSIGTLLRGKADNIVTVKTTEKGKFFTGWTSEQEAIFTNLSMLGMQLRVSGSQGLRFIAELSGNYSHDGIAAYGIAILPQKMIPEGEELTLETKDAKSISSDMEGFKIFSEEDGILRYTVCVVNIEPKNYDRVFTVRPFIRTKVDGVESVAYGDAMSGTILEVAEGLKTQYPGQYDELYEKIMNDYAANFTSAGELKNQLIALSADGMQSLPLVFAEGSALNEKGEEQSNSAWSVTDYIAFDVEKYPILQYCLSGKKGVLSAAFYDGEKNFLSGIGSSSTDEYDILIYNAEIPKEAKYVRFSTHNAFTFSRAEACADIGEKLNAYSTAKDKTDLSGKKIVCVGDSLTYGDYGTTVHGKGYPHAENYPYYLAKYTGASVEWYACGGYTAKALARDYSNGVFSGIGRPGVSVSVKDADIVLVMLGTNGGLPLVGDRSNYDACLSLANNLKNDVKKGARVVLMTPPPATTDESKVNYGYAPNVASAYAGIYKIAGNLSLPVFDVYRDAGFSDENEALFRPNDGLHFAGVGYGALAAFAANELRLLENDRLSAMNLSETENKKDEEFLSTIAYPAYTITDGTYATLGRWFKKTVNGTECDVTVTSGSQLSFLTSGATKATIGFESMCDDTPYFAVSIDGGDYIRYPATENEIMLPDAGRHAVTVVMDGISENIGKWESENGYAVKEITVDKGRIRAIEPTNDVIFYYGDSITEGVMSANSGISCGKNNSAVHTYAFESAKLLGATPYFIGYGATGVTSNGSFAKFSDAIDHLSKLRGDNGEIKPCEIVINHGYNDGAATFEDDLRAALEKLTARFADTPIYYVIPFAQKNADAIRTVCGEFDAVSVIETESLSVEYGTDGIHPTANGAKTAGEYVAKAIEKARLSTSKYADYIEYGKSLQNIHHKLLTDKTANIAYYGGSITQGYGASDRNNIWRNQTKQWFKEHYPDAAINEIYACFGESGTYLGTYLLDDYILSRNPDLVFLEYAINDRYAALTEEQSKIQIETIIRTIKERFPKCDIVMLITIDSGTSGANWLFPAAKAHSEIAKAYNVPVIFMGHALSDYLNTLRKTDLSEAFEYNDSLWLEYFIDIVHPTDKGYLFYTDVIFEYLNNALLAGILEDEYLPDDTLPELVSNHLADGDRKLILLDEESISECDKSVWSYEAGAWLDDHNLRQNGTATADLSKKPTFVYRFTGTELAMYTNIKSGTVSFTYTVDGGEVQTGTFKSHNPTPVVSGLSSGEHVIRITPSVSEAASVGISQWKISLILTRDESKQTTK